MRRHAPLVLIGERVVVQLLGRWQRFPINGDRRRSLRARDCPAAPAPGFSVNGA